MFDKIKDFIKSTPWIQFLLVLLVGIAIGAIFYPD
jgi:uncharacterized membrane-anchored protein YhcB (DUF1043 family)